MARGTSGLDLDRDFMGGEPGRTRDSSPDYGRDKGAGSPVYSPGGPPSPKYPTMAGSPVYSAPSTVSSAPSTVSSSAVAQSQGSPPTRMASQAMRAAAATTAEQSTGSPAPATDTLEQGAAKTGMEELRAAWEAEEAEEDKSSPDSGLGQPGAGRGAARRSSAGSPPLRMSTRRGTSTSGFSSGTASLVCGSTGEEIHQMRLTEADMMLTFSDQPRLADTD